LKWSFTSLSIYEYTMHIIIAEREGKYTTLLTKLFPYLRIWKTLFNSVLLVFLCDALSQIYVVRKYVQTQFFNCAYLHS